MWSASNNPSDQWCKQTPDTISGIDFNEPGPSLPEEIMQWSGQ